MAGFLLVLAGALAGFLVAQPAAGAALHGGRGQLLRRLLPGRGDAAGHVLPAAALPRHAILAPLCVLAVPLYDTVSVVWIRLRAGAVRSRATRITFRIGWSSWADQAQAVLTIYLATAACGLGALLLYQVTPMEARRSSCWSTSVCSA